MDSRREKKANVMRLIQDTVQLQSQQGLGYVAARDLQAGAL